MACCTSTSMQETEAETDAIPKMKEKMTPITEEELQPFGSMFAAAYSDIMKGQEKKARIRKLEEDMDAAGFSPKRICRAVVMMLTQGRLKCTSVSYVRRNTDNKYKDYRQWGGDEVTVEKAIKRVKEGSQKNRTTPKNKETELEVEKEWQDGKEITKVVLERPKEVATASPTTTTTRRKAVSRIIIPQTELSKDDIDIEGDVEVTLPPNASAADKLIKELEGEIAYLKQNVVDHEIQYNKRVGELKTEIKELSRPYQQRQYMTVSVGNEQAIIAYYTIAKPTEKSIGVVKKSAIPLKDVEEKKEDFEEWKKNLKEGRVSVDVFIEGELEPKENLSPEDYARSKSLQSE